MTFRRSPHERLPEGCPCPAPAPSGGADCRKVRGSACVRRAGFGQYDCARHTRGGTAEATPPCRRFRHRGIVYQGCPLQRDDALFSTRSFRRFPAVGALSRAAQAHFCAPVTCRRGRFACARLPAIARVRSNRRMPGAEHGASGQFGPALCASPFSAAAREKGARRRDSHRPPRRFCVPSGRGGCADRSPMPSGGAFFRAIAASVVGKLLKQRRVRL